MSTRDAATKSDIRRHRLAPAAPNFMADGIRSSPMQHIWRAGPPGDASHCEVESMADPCGDDLSNMRSDLAVSSRYAAGYAGLSTLS